MSLIMNIELLKIKSIIKDEQLNYDDRISKD